jgi:thiol-disulfide isomerase/thioredoxin
MAQGKIRLPTGVLIASAILAGMSAGAVGVYVFGGPFGSERQSVAASDPAQSCPARDDKIAAVDKAAQGEVAAMLPADPPLSMSSLAFNGPDGAAMTVAELAGKTLLINLWATWCAPCREEMPALNELQATIGGPDFEVVAVNLDTGGDERPKAFLQEIGVDELTYYRDSTLALFNNLKRRGLAIGLPVTLLVDEEGCLLAHMNGPAEWASDDAKRLIEAAM